MTDGHERRGNSRDADEVFVRDRFESAIGTFELDVASLVAKATSDGIRMRAHRRRLQVGGVAAAVALTVAAGAIGGSALDRSGAGGPTPGSSSHGPSPDHGPRVPSTPKALTAAVLGVLPAGTVVHSISLARHPARHSISTTIGVETPNGRQADLTITAMPPPSHTVSQACAQPANLMFCGTVDFGNGRRAFSSAFRVSTGVDVYVSLQHRGVYLEEKAIATSLSTMALSQRQLAMIASSRFVGITSTQSLVDRAETLFQPGLIFPITIGRSTR